MPTLTGPSLVKALRTYSADELLAFLIKYFDALGHDNLMARLRDGGVTDLASLWYLLRKDHCQSENLTNKKTIQTTEQQKQVAVLHELPTKELIEQLGQIIIESRATHVVDIGAGAGILVGLVKHHMQQIAPDQSITYQLFDDASEFSSRTSDVKTIDASSWLAENRSKIQKQPHVFICAWPRTTEQFKTFLRELARLAQPSHSVVILLGKFDTNSPDSELTTVLSQTFCTEMATKAQMQQIICRYPTINPSNGPDNPWGKAIGCSEIRCFAPPSMSLSLISSAYTRKECLQYSCYNLMAAGLIPQIDLPWLLAAYTNEFKDDAIVKIYTMLLAFLSAVNCIHKYPIFNTQNAKKNTNKDVLSIYYQSIVPHMDDYTVKQYILDLGNLPPEPQAATVPHITAPVKKAPANQTATPSHTGQPPKASQQKSRGTSEWFDPKRMFSAPPPDQPPQKQKKPQPTTTHKTTEQSGQAMLAGTGATTHSQTLLLAGIGLFAAVGMAAYAVLQQSPNERETSLEHRFGEL